MVIPESIMDIMGLLHSSPNITAKEISTTLKVDYGLVVSKIKTMKKKGLIKSTGSGSVLTDYGRYEVNIHKKNN